MTVDPIRQHGVNMVDYYTSVDQCPMDLGGGFMMLPPREHVQNKIPSTISIDDGIFNHPVIILSKSPLRDLGVCDLVAVLVVSPTIPEHLFSL